jgi:ABC-2 type transport system permease protein
VLGCTVVFLALSVWAYDPSRGIQQRKVVEAPAAG